MTRVGVFGACGRMGQVVCAGVAAAPDLELVAAVDPSSAGRVLPGGPAGEVTVAAGPSALADAGAEVAVDFTRAPAAMQNLRWCSSAAVHAISGTSGLSPGDLAELGRLFPGGAGAGASGANCAWVPNFAIGAVLMMHVAEQVAPYFEGVEIIELHHAGKLDAPSGTAAETARRLAAARAAAGAGDWPPDATTTLTLAGARGAEGAGGVRVHSVRLPGLVAHQEILFGAAGQTLSLRHDSYDRGCFVPGVLLAVRLIAGRPGLTVGLDAFLGLA